MTYHNLAGFHPAQHDYRTAEPYARISYQLHIELLGPQHHQTIADGAALASILHRLKQWDEAIARFEAAIAIFDATVGRGHPNTLTCRENAGQV